MVAYTTRNQAKSAVTSLLGSNYSEANLETLLNNLIDTMVLPSDSNSLQTQFDNLDSSVDEVVEEIGQRLLTPYDLSPEDINVIMSWDISAQRPTWNIFADYLPEDTPALERMITYNKGNNTFNTRPIPGTGNPFELHSVLNQLTGAQLSGLDRFLVSDESLLSNRNKYITWNELRAALPSLPSVTNTNNGEILTVVGGAWAPLSSPSGTLPTVSNADNGKILQVINGTWTAAVQTGRVGNTLPGNPTLGDIWVLTGSNPGLYVAFAQNVWTRVPDFNLWNDVSANVSNIADTDRILLGTSTRNQYITWADFLLNILPDPTNMDGKIFGVSGGVYTLVDGLVQKFNLYDEVGNAVSTLEANDRFLLTASSISGNPNRYILYSDLSRIITGNVPTPTNTDTGKSITVNSSGLYVLSYVLPEVDSSDNGKVLKVVSGVWTKADSTGSGNIKATAVYNGAWPTSGTGSWYEIGRVSITPSNSSAKIIVSAIGGNLTMKKGSGGGTFQIFRGTDTFPRGNPGFAPTTIAHYTSGAYMNTNADSEARIGIPMALSGLDTTHNSQSEITYTYIFRPGDSKTTFEANSNRLVITAMEVT